MNAILHKIQEKAGALLPDYARLPLIVTLLWNGVAYYGTRLFTQNWYHYNLETAIDKWIPFLPWTVSIYYGCYLFWVVNYILCARQEKARAYRFLSADFLAKGVCLLCFVLLPTTNTRPVVEPQGFWNSAMVLLYQRDAADNLFPSIHCLASWFCYIGLRGQRNIPRWYRRFSFWMAVAVFLSTLTTKQHVLVDVAGGILLAECSYWLAGHTCFAKVYGQIFDRCIMGRVSKSEARQRETDRCA
jgi:membrane-associated phospholipid phosphatase